MDPSSASPLRGEFTDSAHRFAESDLADASMPYLNRLALRPWERSTALQRLHVPARLLPGHCPLITRWVVLTGATCAGKTTIIKALEQKGYRVMHEIARAYVENEKAKGRLVADIRADDRAYRQIAFSQTLGEELRLQRYSHELIFLDRSAVDSLSFHRGSGYDPHEILSQLLSYRYDKIFHCNPLPFVNDGLRTANEDRRLFIDSALERDYRALGYLPTRVPFGTVEERVSFILSRCSQRQPVQPK